ncbi:MAG TPA: DNA polymerase III subunit beta, partial [Actinomycetota bacterium]
MKIKCDRDALSDALQTVQRAVSSKPGIPALTGVLVTASDQGVVLATTDLEVSARLRLEVQVQAEGVALIPARLLGDMVKSFDQAPVEIDATESQARITCSNYEGTIRCLPAEDFPALQEPSGTRVTVEASGFAEAVGQVARAASRDEARPILTGVVLEINREGLTMMATDSYRLAVRELPATAEGETRVLVPERALSEAGRAAGADEKSEMELFVDQSQAAFRIGPLTLTSRLIEGEVRNYRDLL